MAVRAGITYRYKEKLSPYAEALRKAGVEPVPLLPPGPPSLAGLSGLVISGGTDLNPALYGQAAHAESESPDDERDVMELELMRQALAANLPLLCICRGMQALNVAAGGDLIQHLDTVDTHRQRGVDDAHAVIPVPGTMLAAITGDMPFPVNSRHHQALGRLGEGLTVCARSGDGVIEAIEVPGKRFALAVQWHPEDRVHSHRCDLDLFAAFARAL